MRGPSVALTYVPSTFPTRGTPNSPQNQCRPTGHLAELRAATWPKPASPDKNFLDCRKCRRFFLREQHQERRLTHSLEHCDTLPHATTRCHTRPDAATRHHTLEHGTFTGRGASQGKRVPEAGAACGALGNGKPVLPDGVSEAHPSGEHGEALVRLSSSSMDDEACMAQAEARGPLGSSGWAASLGQTPGWALEIFRVSWALSCRTASVMRELGWGGDRAARFLPFRADYYLRGSNWIFGDLTCRIMSYSLYVNMYSSIYFLTVLSVVRFLATVHPFRLLHVTSIRSAWILCGIIWILTMASSVILLNNGSEQKGSVISCLELNVYKITKLQTMNYIALVVGFLLPFFTLSICYLLVIRALLKVEVPESGLRVSHRKALTTIIITLIIFFLCFLPYHTLRTLHLVTWKVGICEDRLHKAVVITLALAAANTCFSPLLYYFAGENFKDRLRSALRKGHP
ncbi:PREDICTED: cysteinyl leukotriene receptor 2-like [Colobus angolensis palliatus]|uniref:cysteinyl leukotriene receptor 2-like n=1 Tax=Colobus angolensis palliatus TaxID=336983 RepID=UPI0005F514B3|nr:PREDICTED: cysteinyl leukotriene receptor 2-like [Colobus angolensis palliatus]